VLCAAVLIPMFDLRLYEPFVAVAVALLVAVLAVRALASLHPEPSAIT
jgi:CBS-domain-containing membrane protein